MVYSCTRTFCRFLSGVALASVGLGMSVDAAAADWPQWQGPQRTGISEETGLLGQWPEGGPPLVWRVDGIGEGYSSPAIVGDWVYVISSEGMENDERFASLMEKIATLPDLQRTVVMRAYLGGQTLRQIGEELDTPIGTVKSALSRALVRLRECSGVEESLS